MINLFGVNIPPDVIFTILCSLNSWEDLVSLITACREFLIIYVKNQREIVRTYIYPTFKYGHHRWCGYGFTSRRPISGINVDTVAFTCNTPCQMKKSKVITQHLGKNKIRDIAVYWNDKLRCVRRSNIQVRFDAKGTTRNLIIEDPKNGGYPLFLTEFPFGDTYFLSKNFKLHRKGYHRRDEGFTLTNTGFLFEDSDDEDKYFDTRVSSITVSRLTMSKIEIMRGDVLRTIHTTDNGRNIIEYHTRNLKTREYDGLFIMPYKNSTPKVKTYFRNGSYHGEYLEWHPNGKLKYSFKYTNGRREGTCYISDDNGKITEISVWEHGKMTEMIYYVKN
jgi:hypothetical protein